MTINVQTISSIPSISGLLGTTSPQEVIDRINGSMNDGENYFTSDLDPFRERYQLFINQIVAPLRQTVTELQTVSHATIRPEDFISSPQISRITDLPTLKLGIPDEMKLPLLFHPGLYSLHQQGRIFGWGIDPSNLEGWEDPWKDQLEKNSGHMTLEEHYNGKDFVFSSFESYGGIELDEEELKDLRATRNFITELLETTNIDPTSPDDAERG